MLSEDNPDSGVISREESPTSANSNMDSFQEPGPSSSNNIKAIGNVDDDDDVSDEYSVDPYS